jgi:hypothetical protein
MTSKPNLFFFMIWTYLVYSSMMEPGFCHKTEDRSFCTKNYLCHTIYKTKNNKNCYYARVFTVAIIKQ